MLMKRHVLTIVETKHIIGRHGKQTAGQMLDDMIGHHVAAEERLARVVLEFNAADWDALTGDEITPEIKNKYNSDLIRSAYDDDDE